jgi:hypothetical protein
MKKETKKTEARTARKKEPAAKKTPAAPRQAAAAKKSPATPEQAAAAKKSPATPEQEPVIGLKKQYTGEAGCKVTFNLPKEAASGAEKVNVVGDFNGWDAAATPMKKLQDGSFTQTIQLQKGAAYRFKYLIDGNRWENDWHADRYEPNAFASEDSVVVV